MSHYPLDRFVKLTTLLSKPVDQDTLFDVILKEAMLIGNCDGGTIYTVEKDHLVFRYVYTKSKGIALNHKTGAEAIPPVPFNKSYVCAFSAMNKLRMNLKDVYRSKKFDFSGTRKYDERNGYRTCSMLVVPMLVGGGDVLGVLQLINSMDKNGMWTPFTAEQESLISAVGSLAAFYMENLKLKGMLVDVETTEGTPEAVEEEELVDANDVFSDYEKRAWGIETEETKSAPAQEEKKKEDKKDSKGGGFWTFDL